MSWLRNLILNLKEIWERKKIIKNSLSSEDFSDSGKVGKNTYTGGVESTRWQYHGNELEVNQQDHEGSLSLIHI